MYVCLCKGITESAVRECGRQGCMTPEKLAATLGIDQDDCCGRCANHIEEFMAIATDAVPAHAYSGR
jgi:bacterioferritin-associated ferredoxin